MMDDARLPSTWVIEEARTFLQAAQVLEVRAKSSPDRTRYWPSVRNPALAWELFLKSLLVKADPSSPDLNMILMGTGDCA